MNDDYRNCKYIDEDEICIFQAEGYRHPCCYKDIATLPRTGLDIVPCQVFEEKKGER